MASSASSIALKLQKLSNQATEKSFKFNKEEANTARTWQKMMSDTAHQREVADLKKAGLNPTLATNQGAQSYSTSSASDHAENAAGAVGQIYGAEMSADATKKAAAMSAQAMKAAAAQQAAAARYAAAMQYQTQKDSWKWKTDYMKAEYSAKERLINITPPSNKYEFRWKMAQAAGTNDVVFNSKAVKYINGLLSTALNNPKEFFKDNVKINKNNFLTNMNNTGIRSLNTGLKQLGVKPTNYTRNLLGKSVFYNDMKAFNKLTYYMPKKKSVYKNTNSSRTKVQSFHAEDTHGRMVMSNWY